MPIIRLMVVLSLLQITQPVLGPHDQPDENHIIRFAALNKGLYRGGQPTLEGFQFLKQNGLKTIINVGGEDDYEARMVRRLGMQYIHIPIHQVLPWSQLHPDEIAEFFELLDNPANYPIFFHCNGGADRTGALAAFYRVTVQRWD